MKLLFLTQVIDEDDAILGFVPRWVSGLARHCERVRVVALESGVTKNLPMNVDVRVVGRTGTISRWFRYRRILNEALAKDGFDAVLAHMVPRYATLAAGPAQRSHARLYLWYTHAAVDARLRRAERVVSKIFTASPESLRLDTSRKVVTGHGIDLDHFEDRGERSVLPPRIVAVGRLSSAKDPLVVMEAVSILAAEGRDLVLDLVGGGLTVIDKAYGEKVSERASRADIAGRVQLTGAVPYKDIPRMYARAALVVNASSTGSIDKVVLEGMASRRPILSCNEAVPAIVREFGAEADRFLFAPGDARDLAKKIGWWLDRSESERAAYGERLRAIVARDHEVDTLMKRLCVEMGGDS
ncbi:MAG: glycosyltransferase family 4 protein [Planctomycetota bacterium]|nr:glycosyltransferase family 4 protein [Planctomycetota bacterium]